jgi:sirohydrochlorin cobaltochelatase
MARNRVCCALGAIKSALGKNLQHKGAWHPSSCFAWKSVLGFGPNPFQNAIKRWGECTAQLNNRQLPKTRIPKPLMLNTQPQTTIELPVNSVGILLVGHGTRNLAGQREFLELFELFAACVAPHPAKAAFLELAQPDIRQSIEELHRAGAKQVLVVPAILFTAGHAESDIPSAVRDSLAALGMECIGQTAALECSPELLELSAIRFRESVCDQDCATGCSGKYCRDSSWLLIGRGSSSQSATEKAREFGRLRRQLTPTAFAQTAFIHGQLPTVDKALDEFAFNRSARVVVQPHLLFSGLLMQQLKGQVEERQQRFPLQQWILTSTLGADGRLAQLLADRALHLLAKFGSCSKPTSN